MAVEWTDDALADLERLHDFLSVKSPRAAVNVALRLTEAPRSLPLNPRRGPIVERYLPKEVRRLIVGDYELRYEIRGDDIFVVALFHTREDR